MRIWVDADSCPVKIREIISKAAKRVEIEALYVANRVIPVQEHDYIRKIVTSNEDQSADKYILDNIKESDIVITRDIPLADELVNEGLTVLNDRGDIYTKENIKERLSIRDFMKEARELGLGYESTNRFGPKDVQNFSNSFDKILRQKTS
ncbi:YaiI/YqxD family protein [Thiospirochaeta perfilievii]|uniref:UPF0178 protein EW093_16560 n=1 Tax=Thiospirochaeta perfilievii TaxID=252967 RepID=A0A5C1QFD6_9SPIO|nr:YaiI/YqxD family protein [Thiospirochaeta perfilievii]QEN06231.1 YaiI/YqxD family protein [Thiospirochaeta perfilievii]